MRGTLSILYVLFEECSDRAMMPVFIYRSNYENVFARSNVCECCGAVASMQFF
jgi:hypothetical protein